MSDDSELKRMFSAQRKIDEKLVPSFDEIHAKSSASGDTLPAPPVDTLFPMAIAVPAIALAAFIIILTCVSLSEQHQQQVPSTAVTDTHRMNQVCDSLLGTIHALDSRTMAQTNQESDQEMEWPTGTDSLISFDTLSFSARTSP